MRETGKLLVVFRNAASNTSASATTLHPSIRWVTTHLVLGLQRACSKTNSSVPGRQDYVVADYQPEFNPHSHPSGIALVALPMRMRIHGMMSGCCVRARAFRNAWAWWRFGARAWCRSLFISISVLKGKTVGSSCSHNAARTEKSQRGSCRVASSARLVPPSAISSASNLELYMLH